MRSVLMVVVCAIVGIVALPTSASAQFDLSKIGGMLGGSSSSPDTRTSPYKVLAENAPAKSEVLGEWRYNDFKLEYLGINSFATAAIGQVEGYAREELTAAGITPGCFTITLHKSGKGSFKYGEYAYVGEYTYDSSNARFELTATAENGKTLQCGGFLKMEGGNLVVMFKAEDALNAFAAALPESPEGDDSTFDMINGVVQNFPGIYISMYCLK